MPFDDDEALELLAEFYQGLFGADPLLAQEIEAAADRVGRPNELLFHALSRYRTAVLLRSKEGYTKVLYGAVQPHIPVEGGQVQGIELLFNDAERRRYGTDRLNFAELPAWGESLRLLDELINEVQLGL